MFEEAFPNEKFWKHLDIIVHHSSVLIIGWSWKGHLMQVQGQKTTNDQIHLSGYLDFVPVKFVHNGKYQTKFALLGNIKSFSGVPKVWNWDKCEWFYPKSTPSNLNLLDLLWILVSHLHKKWKRDKVTQSYLIFVIFSPQAQFLAQFFSMQKRVNCDKTDFATKQRFSGLLALYISVG